MLYQIKFVVPSDLTKLIEYKLESEDGVNAFSSIAAELERSAEIFSDLSKFLSSEGVKVIRSFEEGVYIECNIEIPSKIQPWLVSVEPSQILLDEHISLFRESLDSATQIGSTVQYIAPLTSGILADCFASLEKEGYVVRAVLMSADRYADLRRFGRDILDIETRAWVLRKGLQSRIWGASIITDRACGNKVTFLGVGGLYNGWGKFVAEFV